MRQAQWLLVPCPSHPIFEFNCYIQFKYIQTDATTKGTHSDYLVDFDLEINSRKTNKAMKLNVANCYRLSYR